MRHFCSTFSGCLRCLRCLTPCLRIVSAVPTFSWLGPAPASTKCGDFCQFFWRSHSTPKKRLRGTAGLFVEFLIPNGMGLVHPTRWGLILVRPTCARYWLAQPRFFDTGSPNSVSILARPTPFLILVRPTPFRYWLAQLRFDTAILHVFGRPPSSRGWGGAEAFGWDRGETPETPETPTKRRTGVSQTCLRPVSAITRQPAKD